MGLRRNLRWTVALLLALAPLATVAATGATTPRGTVTVAESPGDSPNYIFPFASCQYYSVSNVNQFQMLMFRPLYWFGLRGSPALVPSLSLANPPLLSRGNRSVTVSLKGWRFADGQAVNTRSVMFFLNMERADPTAYCASSESQGASNQVRSVSASGNTVTVNFVAPENPNWVLYDFLSQITPMPDIWDRTSPTRRATCAGAAFGSSAAKVACTAVAKYLGTVGASTSTFAGPLWQSGVDGPWRLTAFDAAGDATFAPNPHYSGPQKPQVRVLKELAYTSTAAEENDLKTGRLSIGYLDPSVLTSPAPAPGRPGANWGPIASTYTMQVGTPWGFSYAALNFSTADPESAAINQLYVRQALQLAVDQGTIIQTVFNGYATPVYSPLPTGTPSSLAGPIANPYPYSPAGAAALLAGHGWTLSAGVLTCTNPGTGTGQCGAGISAGYPLKFNVVVAGNSASLAGTVSWEAASWRSLGIGVTVLTASFDTVVGDCRGGSGFEICAWGTGWTYQPGYYPSGEALFSPNSTVNVGTYSDATMQSLVAATLHGSTTLTAYARYAAHDLPVLYQPQGTIVEEVAKTLRSDVGFAPNPLGAFLPEYYHF